MKVKSKAKAKGKSEEGLRQPLLISSSAVMFLTKKRSRSALSFCLLPFAFCLLPFAICLLPFAFCHLPFAFALHLYQPYASIRRRQIQQRTTATNRSLQIMLAN